MFLRFLAFLLSYVPGAGHALRGLWLRGVIAAVLGIAAFAVEPWAGPVAAGLALAVRLGIAIDAARGEGRFPGWTYFIAGVGVFGGALAMLGHFWVERYRFPTGSMIPTLEAGDEIAVWKAGTPRRGDVILFVYPREPSKQFAKRVIAVGGDKLEVKDNQIILNGKPVPREPVAGPCAFDDFDERLGNWSQHGCEKFTETLDGHRYQVVVAKDEFAKDFPGPGDPTPYVVPAGEYFVLGDNRNNSHDSRFWGGVPAANVEGRVMRVRYSKGKDGIRWERFGKEVP